MSSMIILVTKYWRLNPVPATWDHTWDRVLGPETRTLRNFVYFCSVSVPTVISALSSLTSGWLPALCVFQIIGSVCYRSSSPELNISVPSSDEYLILQKTRQAWPDDISAVRINTLNNCLCFFNKTTSYLNKIPVRETVSMKGLH